MISALTFVDAPSAPMGFYAFDSMFCAFSGVGDFFLTGLFPINLSVNTGLRGQTSELLHQETRTPSPPWLTLIPNQQGRTPGENIPECQPKESTDISLHFIFFSILVLNVTQDFLCFKVMRYQNITLRVLLFHTSQLLSILFPLNPGPNAVMEEEGDWSAPS